MRRTTCVVSLALLLGGCAAAPEPRLPEPEPAVEELPVVDVPNLTERALLLLLVDRQLFEPVAVGRARQGDAELRAELAESLGQIGDPRGVPVLLELLFDDAPAVRRAAAFALGELGERDATAGLLRAAAGEDAETGRLAVEALGKLDVPVDRVGDALLALPEAERWERLLPALFRFRQEASVPLAEAGLAVDDPDLHARAAYALARDPLPEAAPALRRLLDDPDPWVRGWAARGLGEVGEGADLERLTPLVEGEAPGPIVQALRAARRMIADGRAAPPERWRDRLVELLEGERPHLRLAALRVASAWLLDPRLGELLVARASGEGEPWEHPLALVALARGEHPRAAALASEAGRSGVPARRAAAATAAATLGLEELLERLRHDPSPRVRIAALEGLLVTADEPAEVARRALTDTDPGVRTTLFDWLVEHPVAPVEELGEAVVSSLADRQIESSLSGVRALAARAEAERLERGALVALLEELAGFSDLLVRRAAAVALAGLGVEVPPLGIQETDRELSGYETVLQRTQRPRTVEIRTGRGSFRVRLACPAAPLTCLNFLNLARQGFYDGTVFHRVVADFVVQGGDPRGDGWGGPPYTVRDEIHRHLRYRRGVVGMALAGPDTGGSQFFVTLSPQPHLDGGYTAFGEVVAGLETVMELVPGEIIERVTELRRGAEGSPATVR